MTKFSIKTMAGMSQLFATKTPDQLTAYEDVLADEAQHAGVYREAATDGLTMAQWEIVRDPRKALKSLILSL